jgi:hypothetical protein
MITFSTELSWIEISHCLHMKSKLDVFNNISFHGIGDIDHRCLAALIMLENNKAVLVVAIHLTAYENMTEKRAQEFGLVCEAINSIPDCETDEYWRKVAFKTIKEDHNVIICGDLNLHAPCETRLIYECGFQDTWIHHSQLKFHETTNVVEKKKNTFLTEEECANQQQAVSTSLTANIASLGDGEVIELLEDDKGEDASAGYTWDPKRNPFINTILPFDNRRMRLDRMLLPLASPMGLKCTHVSIFGDEPIHQSRGYKLLNYLLPLFPSDHFGLVADFDVATIPTSNRSNNNRNESVALKMREDMLSSLPRQTVTGFRTIPMIIAMRLLACAGAVLVIGVISFGHLASKNS